MLERVSFGLGGAVMISLMVASCGGSDSNLFSADGVGGSDAGDNTGGSGMGTGAGGAGTGGTGATGGTGGTGTGGAGGGAATGGGAGAGTGGSAGSGTGGSAGSGTGGSAGSTGGSAGSGTGGSAGMGGGSAGMGGGSAGMGGGSAGMGGAAGSAGSAGMGGGGCTMKHWCLDEDDDTYGNPRTRVSACVAPSDGHIEDTGGDRCMDCEDGLEDVHPGQTLCFGEFYATTGPGPSMRSFDYNCDGANEEACSSVPKAGTCVLAPTGPAGCTGSGYLPSNIAGDNLYCGSMMFQQCVLAGGSTCTGVVQTDAAPVTCR